MSANTSRTIRAASVSSAGSGWSTARRRAFDPFATALQKKSVAPVPTAPPPGTAMLVLRQSSDHAIGSVHWDLRFGPVGPLKNARCSSPQRPPKPIQGNAWSAAAGSLGIVSTTGWTSKVGPRVSSQPTPSEPELPR